jgi:methyltransferase (TIGR00027 family)
VTPVEHVSDTALWVAVYRAMETERPDALFRDPFARRLAGERGEELLDSIPWARQTAWAMIVRTAVMDEIILRCVERQAVTQIVNLAAGLDARPYRLRLPPSLRWIEVDLPDILAYKSGILEGETPLCELETVSLDLSDGEGRRALFRRLDAAGRKTLVVAEGLLIYLQREDVAALADDLHAAASFGWWLIDLASPMLLEWMQKRYGRGMDPGKVPFRFAPAEGPEFFAPHGWKVAELRFNIEEARRLHREMRGAWITRLIGRLFPGKAEEFRRMGMTVLLERG